MVDGSLTTSCLSSRVPQSDDAACTPEPHVVMQMTVDDMVSLIHNHIQVGTAVILTNLLCYHFKFLNVGYQKLNKIHGFLKNTSL